MPKKRISFARNVVREARENVEEAKDKTESFMKKNPWTSVAIAAGVGAAVALIVNAVAGREKKSFASRVRDYFD